jgi:uncharacterized Tic20 family protein
MENEELMGQTNLPAVTPSQDERTMALLSHILTLLSMFLAPLIIYLIKKDESSFVAEHAKESLNFQITVGIGYIICFVLMLVLIGVFLLAVLGLVSFILVIVATIKASEGKLYKYPFNLRLIK